MREKRRYANGQSRGGTPGTATNTNCPEGRRPKDYNRVAVSFHGNETKLNEWKDNGMKGYRT